MDDPAHGVDDLLRRIADLDADTARTAARAETYQRMAARLRAVRGQARSEDGVVTVTAAPGGAVTDIAFAPAVRRTDPKALAAVVLHTVASAQANAAALQAEVVRQELGDTTALDRVLAEDRLTFGDPPPSPGPTPPSAYPRRAPTAGDEPEFEVRVFDEKPSW